MTDNRGARALRAAAKELSQTEIGAKTGISQSWLSRLARAEGKPNREQSLLLKRDVGIELEWWDEEEPANDSGPDTEPAPAPGAS